MNKKRFLSLLLTMGILSVSGLIPAAFSASDAFKETIYQLGILKPFATASAWRVVNKAPILPSLPSGEKPFL